MSIERIEQTREILHFEITVAVNNPKGPLNLTDDFLTMILDKIEKCLKEKVEK